MKTIGSTFDRSIELAARRMPEFRVELIFQNGEILNSVIGNRREIARHGFGVVVHALYCEVVVTGPLPAHRWPRTKPKSTRIRDART